MHLSKFNLALNLVFEEHGPSPEYENHEEFEKEQIREGRNQTVKVLSLSSTLQFSSHSAPILGLVLFMKLEGDKYA